MIGTKATKAFIWNAQEIIKEEGKGNHDTATDNEWKHLRDTRHQVFVEGLAH